mmetsp:Transcript_23241/g.51709  ORF Transcript_23241/g.51709 Transcript_23241/m.51709 type:complete len:82 (+) Transcript_23241:259-504(+)
MLGKSGGFVFIEWQFDHFCRKQANGFISADRVAVCLHSSRNNDFGSSTSRGGKHTAEYYLFRFERAQRLNNRHRECHIFNR